MEGNKVPNFEYLLPQTRLIQCAIITTNRETRILQLEISSGLEIVENLLANGAVVFEACDHGACVNEIEWLVESPFVFCIVDLEFAVGWVAS